MTSEVRPSECYVYITLPGETEAVTAGRYALTTDAHGTAIGRFVYGRSYLARVDSVPIDPIELKSAWLPAFTNGERTDTASHGR